MDRLTPLDLERAEIPIRFRGYDRNSVDQLLDRASKEIERLLNELRSLQSVHEASLKELSRLREHEETVKEAIVLAQRVADETRASAHREADLIREEASRAKSEAVRLAQAETEALRREIERLEEVRRSIRSRLRVLAGDLERLAEDEEASPIGAVSLEVRNGAVE